MPGVQTHILWLLEVSSGKDTASNDQQEVGLLREGLWYGVKHHRPVTAAGVLLSKSKVMLEAVAFPQHAMATGGQEEKQAPLFLSESTSP